MGRKPLKDQRRKEILEALYRCLLEKSYSETSIKDIGRKAGLNPAMLHYYFESKEDILINLVDSIYEEHRRAFEKRLRELQEMGLEARGLVREILRYFNENVTCDKKLQKVFFEIWEVALHNRNVSERVKRIYREWIDGLSRIFNETIGPCPDADNLALAAVAFQEGVGIFSVFFRFRRDYTRALLEGFQERILEML
ncbi:TetR/AcrR family transcriptional regulator [Candidatus Solincola sp.]|nr:TetR/AcrR family transcriptional regulator [Actinomycetota bacterium]